jgi:hypothetical protein
MNKYLVLAFFASLSFIPCGHNMHYWSIVIYWFYAPYLERKELPLVYPIMLIVSLFWQEGQMF